MAQNPATELCALLNQVAAKATELAALPFVDGVATIQAKLTQLDATLSSMNTLLAGHTTMLARIEATLGTHATTLATHTAALERVEEKLARLDRRTAIAYNAGCGEGSALQFVAVPNADGELPGPLLPVVPTAADFRVLSPAQVNALAVFYDIHAPAGVARKDQLKHALGLSFP
jgi:hypothetical protein